MSTDPREWRRLMEAGAVFTAFMDLDDVLRQVLPYAAESAGAEWSAVLLHDPEAAELVVAAASGAGARLRGRRYVDTEGVAGAVMKSGRARIMAHVATADRLLDSVFRDGHPVHSLMAAPLRVGARTLGVVLAMNLTRTGDGDFQAADLDRFVGSCSLMAVAVENASLYRRLHHGTEILERSAEDAVRPLVAASEAMQRVLDQADRVAAGRSTVLLVGETGTGKEQVARRIHAASPRAGMPFVALNCGALPETLLESELFGHEKGAFTGADRRRIGRFELADGGTLFLDEIGELSPAAQVKLLRVLQEHEIRRVGGTETIYVNVRVIVATHRDLSADVAAGRFREDLFFRIHVVPIVLPPLRDRRDDVEPLASLFVSRLSRELGRPARGLTGPALDRLRSHHWPGNVRELENLIERLLVLGDDGPITADEVSQLLPGGLMSSSTAASSAVSRSAGTVSSSLGAVSSARSADPALEDLSLPAHERRLLVEALQRVGQNQTRAAALLEISREQLRTRMKRYGLLAQKT